MIQPTDLRLGNIVYDTSAGLPKGYMVIVELKHLQDTSNLEPIPLTKELLLKAGFEKDKDRNSYYHDCGNGRSKFDVTYYEGRTSFKSRYQEEMFEVQELKHIQYFHQLQNLYHAITGEELSLNYRYVAN